MGDSEKQLASQEPPIQQRVPVEVLMMVPHYTDDINGLVEAADFEGCDLSREDARQLIRLFTDEDEADQLASAPSGTDFLVSQTDKMLKRELDRLAEEQELLQKIADKDPQFDYEIKATGVCVSPAAARERLELVLHKILTIKKSLSEDVKAKSKNDGMQVNMQMNFGEYVNEALNNVRSSDSFVEPTVKQVPSIQR